MSMAMLLNAATAAEARQKLLDPGRGRITIHSLLCPAESPSDVSGSISLHRQSRAGSVLGKRKLGSGVFSAPSSPKMRSSGPLSRHSSNETSAGSGAECWSSDGFTDSDSSPSSPSRLRSPARRRRASPSLHATSAVPFAGGNGAEGSPQSWRGDATRAIARNAPRRRWKEDEDQLLLLVVRQHGPGRWNRLAEQFPGRNGRQVRLRWMNHLQPSLDKREWRKEEDEILLAAHAVLGNKWALIAMKLNGRTDNSVKNRYKSLMRKQQREIRARTPSR